MTTRAADDYAAIARRMGEIKGEEINSPEIPGSCTVNCRDCGKPVRVAAPRAEVKFAVCAECDQVSDSPTVALTRDQQRALYQALRDSVQIIDGVCRHPACEYNEFHTAPCERDGCPCQVQPI